MPPRKLTNAFIQKAICPPRSAKVVYSDTVVNGLICEVRNSGNATFYFRHTVAPGQYKHIRIGDGRSVRVEVARQKARQLHNLKALGEDPAEQVKPKPVAPTLNTFFDKRYLPYIKSYRVSWYADQRFYETHFRARLGTRRMDVISRQDIAAFRIGLSERGYSGATVNRIIAMIRYMFNLAIDWETPGLEKNPAARSKLTKVNTKKECFLSSSEVGRLLVACNRSRNRHLHDIVKFLLLTGARKREALDAKWQDFDLDGNGWIIPVSKTGFDRPVTLSDTTVAFMCRLPSRERSEYLFPCPETDQPYSDIFGAWSTARERAGLQHVRLHDLRHSFASFLINEGVSLYEVQKLLGHSNLQMTQRYAHLSNDRLRASADEASKYIPA